jgi:hypothetical protein
MNRDEIGSIAVEVRIIVIVGITRFQSRRQVANLACCYGNQTVLL